MLIGSHSFLVIQKHRRAASEMTKMNSPLFPFNFGPRQLNGNVAITHIWVLFVVVPFMWTPRIYNAMGDALLSNV